MVISGAHRINAVLAAHVDGGARCDFCRDLFEQELFKVGLLQIDKGGMLVPGFG